MKKVTLALLIVVCLFSFIGCQSAPMIDSSFVMVSLGRFSSGKTIQKFDFSLDSNFLRQNGFDEEDIEKAKANLIENVDVFRKEFVLSFELIYQASENKNSDFLVNGELLTITQTTYNQNTDSVGFSMVFENQEVWDFYHQSSTQNPDETEGNKNSQGIVFVETQSTTSIFPFVNEVSVGEGQKMTVAERYRQAYLKSVNFASNYSQIEKNYSPDFVYNYGTSYGNINSDADSFFQDVDGLYHHVWVKNYKNLSADDTITLYVNSANKGWWYMFYLLAVIIVMVGAIAIVKIIERKRIKKA